VGPHEVEVDEVVDAERLEHEDDAAEGMVLSSSSLR